MLSFFVIIIMGMGVLGFVRFVSLVCHAWAAGKPTNCRQLSAWERYIKALREDKS